METATYPEPGQKWVRFHTSYTILDVSDETVVMRDNAIDKEVEETVERFLEEVENGNAVHHPKCTRCDLPVDPDEGRSGPLHYQCWFSSASVRERCEAEAERPSGNRLASEALRHEDAREHLLSVLGDPVRTFHDRIDAENLLAGAVSTSTLLDAMVRCPECREGEVFKINPTTGAVRCHCGELLKPAD